MTPHVSTLPQNTCHALTGADSADVQRSHLDRVWCSQHTLRGDGKQKHVLLF